MQEFERLFWSLLPNAGQIISSQQLMADIGIKATLFHYLKFSKARFINKAVNTGGSFERIKTSTKIISRLIQLSDSQHRSNSTGFKVETYVSSLIHNYNKLFYHKRNKEIDFILPDKNLQLK